MQAHQIGPQDARDAALLLRFACEHQMDEFIATLLSIDRKTEVLATSLLMCASELRASYSEVRLHEVLDSWRRVTANLTNEEMGYRGKGA